MASVVIVFLVAALVHMESNARADTATTADEQHLGCVGEKGDKGDVGHSGPPGYRGLKGERGTSGAQGSTGEKGEMGARGRAGPPGPQGSAGVIGSPGKPGLQGPPGNTGLQGQVGPTGPPGIKGQKGSMGIEGNLGPRGVAGADGQPGPPGHRGIEGQTGMKGEKGVDGEPGHKGERGPQGIIDSNTLKDYFEPVKTLQTEMANVTTQLQELLNGPAAHLSGLGRGWRSFSSGTTISYWYTSSGSTWSPFLRGGMTYSNGILTVPQDGLYYVYTQLYFNHHTASSSYAYARFSIDINGSDRAHSYQRSNDVYHAYYMGRLLPLQKGDQISIVNGHSTNRMAFDHQYSFFGAFKLP